jgi:hypothetical protein
MMHSPSFSLLLTATVPTIFVSTLAGAGLAAASPARPFADQLGAYSERIDKLQYNQSASLDRKYTIAGCNAVIAKARAAGLAPSTVLHANELKGRAKAFRDDHEGKWAVRLADAPSVCREFADWQRIGEAERALKDAHHFVNWLGAIDVASNHEENAAKLGEAGVACTTELERLIGEGLRLDVTIELGGKELVLRDARAQVCGKLVAAAETFAAEVKAARERRYAERAAPYKKIGITGDRLELLVDHYNYPMYAVGGRELKTPAELKKAKVIFEVLLPGTHTVWTVRKYQFQGDKVISTTSREYDRAPTAAAFR